MTRNDLRFAAYETVEETLKVDGGSEFLLTDNSRMMTGKRTGRLRWYHKSSQMKAKFSCCHLVERYLPCHRLRQSKCRHCWRVMKSRSRLKERLVVTLSELARTDELNSLLERGSMLEQKTYSHISKIILVGVFVLC